MFQITSFGIGIGFLFAGLSYIFNSGASINEEVQKANLSNSWAFILIGVVLLALLMYYSTKLSLVTVTHKGIEFYNTKKKTIEWNDIYFIEIKHFIVDHCIQVHTRDGSRINIQPDKPSGFDFNDAFQPEKAYLRSKMWQRINKALEQNRA